MNKPPRTQGISRAHLVAKLERRDDELKALRREVKRLRGAKELADQRLVTIRTLTRQLAAERRLNTALSELEWVPSKQSKARIEELKRALAAREDALQSRAA